MSKWTDEGKRFTNAMARQFNGGAKYVPAEKFGWAPGGVAKSAAAIVWECIQGNEMLAALLRGEPMSREAMAAAHGVPESLSYEKAKPLLDASVAAVCDAIDGWAEKDLTTMLQLPWGPTMPVEGVIFLPGTHMNYHNGQLNYIQALLGDGENHWE